MEQHFSNDYDLERLAVKSLYAADVLRNTIRIAENLQKLQKKVSRNIQQVKLILTWKQGCGVIKMAGSATKVVGGVVTLIAPLHPKLGLIVKVSHKLWKFGAGLKILTTIGQILKDLWQIGFRNSLMDFVHATTLLTQNLDVLGEVIQDLQTVVQSTNNNAIQSPEALINSLKPFIPQHQLDYFIHIINITLGNQHYSPLFDFIMMSCEPSSSSNIHHLMRELESFNFTKFVQEGTSKSLIAIGSFLHICCELLDFLDGFSKVTDQDCRFLSECLTKFTQESLKIMSAVAVLNNLHKILR